MSRDLQQDTTHQESRGKQAFTLIELLASITILVMLTAMIGVIFAESERAWSTGTDRAQSNMAGRGALDLLGLNPANDLFPRNSGGWIRLHGLYAAIQLSPLGVCKGQIIWTLNKAIPEILQ